MPHRKKKSFIEKKKAVTFHLVHRSQRDPLAADEKAPQHVLLPATKVEAEKRREEQRNYGVFFDDDYDYLQHLKEASGQTELVAAVDLRKDGEFQLRRDGEQEEEERTAAPTSINLPSSVFASEFEEEVGLLNKAAPISGPRLDLDPDIVAALDEDFDFDDPENLLDDDFIVKANSSDRRALAGAEDDEEDDDDEEWEDTDEDDEDIDSDGGFSDERIRDGGVREFLFEDEETRTRFTEYSMTSSVMRRNEQLTLLDDRFEKFYEQFDDDEIGALDNAELEGFIAADSSRLDEVIQDYYRQKQNESLRPEDLGPKELPVLEEVESSSEEELETVVMEAPDEKWDCETIISTYSNIYNRPKVIEEPQKPKQIRVSVKSGIPLDVLPSRGPTAKQTERMSRINDSDLPRAATQPRGREETADERRQRKHAIKEERKERRVEKKANKTAFKQEKVRQEKQLLNLRTNVQGLKL